MLPALPVLVEESAAALGDDASEGARREHTALCSHVAIVLKDNGQYEPALAQRWCCRQRMCCGQRSRLS